MTKEAKPTEKQGPSLRERLAEPFDPEDVHFKPATVKGNRCLALAYIDARAVMDRLDEVVGPGGWEDDYEFLPSGSVVCRLRVRIGSEWITHTDVGSESEQPDGGDRHKAAVSDALKRVAVKFGVGRYLYRLPRAWCDYDPARRQIARHPKLPAWALPGSTGGKPAAAVKPAADEQPASQAAPALPATGAELQKRLAARDALLAAQGVCAPGELVRAVVDAGVRVGYDRDLRQWKGPAFQLAVEATKAFEQARAKKGTAASAKPKPTAADICREAERLGWEESDLGDYLASLDAGKPEELTQDQLDLVLRDLAAKPSPNHCMRKGATS